MRSSRMSMQAEATASVLNASAAIADPLSEDAYAIHRSSSEARRRDNDLSTQAGHQWLQVRSQSPSDRMSEEMVTQCYRILETIIHTVHDEYRSGSRSHWGAEDRRTKLWFIVMGQNTITGFFGVLLSGISPALVHVVFEFTNRVY